MGSSGNTEGPVDSVLELIGRTPMVKLKRISREIPAEIWAKLEYLNPSGSIKDRIALRMIEVAERSSKITAGATIVEPTSGNTGIALALVCALKGYRMIAVVPEAVSGERRMLVVQLGGRVEVVKDDGIEGVSKDDMEGVVRRARELVAKIPNSFMPDQFVNESNPCAHAETTAAEILEQTNGRLSAFVAACGTGGTFTGVAQVLKAMQPEVRNIAVEPSGSAVLSGRASGHHKIQGIGEGFIPKVMRPDLADEIVAVSDDEAFATARRLWKEEGIMGGISSGANVYAALKIGAGMKPGSVIVTIIADSGLRYLSTELFQ
jgi:cysteine synthase A